MNPYSKWRLKHRIFCRMNARINLRSKVREMETRLTVDILKDQEKLRVLDEGKVRAAQP